MREYFKPTGPAAQVRAHVDEHQNCEDIGINYVAAAAKPKMDPPVYVKITPNLIRHRYSYTIAMAISLPRSRYLRETHPRARANTSQEGAQQQ
jgi:hypothetical protein